MQKRQAIQLIKASEIREHYSMLEAIDDMEKAFTILSAGESIMPQRYVTKLEQDNLNLLLKPAAIESMNKLSIKILTQKESRMIDGIPTIVGIVLVIDTITGEIVSIMDGEYITALRTGAASGLATKYFSRADANTLAIFGFGAQGKTQLEAVTAVRDIKKVWIYDLNESAAKSLIAELQANFNAHIEYTNDLSNLTDCDVICTATN